MAAAFAASPRQTAAPAVTAFRGGSETPTVQRAPLRLSSPQDTAEREAAAAARTVMTMHLPRATAPRVAGAGLIQRSPAADGGGGGTADRLPSSPAGGTPLPAGVRSFMEPRFGADFGAVRMHTDANAAVLSRQLAAQAFTTGNHIYFGGGRYQPETASGRELIAHELAHTVQQGAAPRVPQVQRSADLTLTPQPSGLVQRLGVTDALDFFADRANLIPGFRMFTIVLGVNPINMSRVERSAANILRALVELLPGGALITQALDNHGVFDRVGTWVEQQIRSLGMTGSIIRDALNRFLDSLSWRDIFNLGGVWERARRIFTEPIDRILAFGRGLVNGIIQFVKDAILMPLARLASNTRGWDLLCAVLGRNPITGDAVPRNAETLIGGFMKLIGQEEVWENIKRGNAVARAWAWFQGALAGVMAFVREIPTLFVQALRSLEIADIVLLPRAFAKVASVFGSFALRFVGWAGAQVLSLLQIIFEVVAPQVMVYLRRAAGAFGTIVRDPGRFVGNLVRAGLQGLRQFAGNFLTHLRASLIGWLTGAMSGANIYIPQGFNLREIVKFILSVLGLTWQNIRAKLVRAIGETAVAALERGFDIVMTLVREGPAAAWDKIVESITNLRDMVIEQVMTFVRDRIVTAAITRLVSMLNPVGAFIQAIIAIYNTVMFFVERLRQIAQVAAAVIDSLAAIAAGVITAAANRVEQTMAGLLTLVISFLARIAGLGRVSDAVINIINRVRQPIDRALDRVVAWIVAQGRRLGRLLAGGARDTTSGASPEDAATVPFAIGREQHTLRTQVVGGRLALRMSSELVADFSDRVQRIRSEWIPLRRGHPAGNLEAELNAMARDGESLIVAANRRRTERTRSRAMNDAISQLATRLRDICRRFDITRIEGISNYRDPPPHQPTYQAVDGYGRAQGMSVTLSFRSRAHMRGTSSTGVNVPGTTIAGYQKGHLLAASLGGSNSNVGNYAPMSPRTNTARGGIATFETALRGALHQDLFPPWIVVYSIRCVHTGSAAELGTEIGGLVGAAQAATAGPALFALARSNVVIDATRLRAALPTADPVLVTTHAERIKNHLLMHFTPRRFTVDVRIEQAPEGAVLPASSPFDNHM